jgi:hypothetical protein
VKLRVGHLIKKLFASYGTQRLITVRFWVFTAVTMETTIFW